MPVLVTCPACGSRFRAPDSAAGKRSTCPKCGGSVVIAAVCPHAAPSPGQPTEETANTGEWPAPQATEYPRMRRSFALLRARRKVRTILDTSGFGPSALGRLCFALIPCAVLFGGSLLLSFAMHAQPAHAIAQATAIFIAAFVPLLVLVLGPGDEELATRLNYMVAHLAKAEDA